MTNTVKIPVSRIPGWAWGLALVLAGLLAYCNCYVGEFIMDDNGAIVGNPHITALWPLREALTAPPRTTTSGRPVICLSLALNYAFCGMEFWGYRAVNLAVHIVTALAIFGIIRITLEETPSLRQKFGTRTRAVAFAAVLLWLVHPLHTQVVNYIIQRAESIMAMFYVVTLYCAVRAWHSRQTEFWQTLAVACCALGMGSKEVMVSAPLMVLFYDRAYRSGSFAAAFRRSRMLYLGLAATWLIAGILIAMGGTANGAKVGRLEYGPVGYGLTQAGVITHYLRLCFWPDPLCFDYAWPVARTTEELLPGLFVVATMLIATLWTAWKKPTIGFLGLWFFALLAPSSSVMPLPDMAVEYRVYLASAAIILCAVLAAEALIVKLSAAKLGVTTRWPRIAGAVICAAVAIIFTALTFFRNQDYHSAVAIWSDTIAKRPGNARARVNLGIALASEGKLDAAEKQFDAAIKINPAEDALSLNYGCLLAMQGRTRQALPLLYQAVSEEPDSDKAHYNLGNALSDLGRKPEAMNEYLSALKLNPRYKDAHFNLAIDLLQKGDTANAERHLIDAIRSDPQFAAAHDTLGLLFEKSGKNSEALRHFKAALEIDPQDVKARAGMARLSNN